FINAAEYYSKDKKQNTLLPEHIDKIVETYRDRKEEDRYSRRVSLREIVENDYNLNITRYVSLAQEEAPVNLSENHDKLVEIEKNLAEARTKFNGYLRELGLKEI
ncbi:MAG: N-6 DNA methylase, partial [Bacteroidales bacterium]|nr:N-6 DNA methylase [Bacteroidales bacterium]